MKKIYQKNQQDLPERINKLFGLTYLVTPANFQAKEANPNEALIVEVKAFDPNAEMIIEGIANLAEPDRWQEIIPPEAWDLKNFEKNPIILRDHDRSKPVGIALDTKISKTGLEYRAQIGAPELAPLTEDQIDTRSLLAQKILRTNSVGFIPHVIEWDEDTETLKYIKVELLEISIVSIPMQQDSLITSVKSFQGKKNMTVKAADDSYAELKGMIEDHAACTKKIHDMVEKLMPNADEEPDEDDAKALHAEIAKKDAEIVTLKASLEEAEKSMNELVDNLQKQGLITGENV